MRKSELDAVFVILPKPQALAQALHVEQREQLDQDGAPRLGKDGVPIVDLIPHYGAPTGEIVFPKTEIQWLDGESPDDPETGWYFIFRIEGRTTATGPFGNAVECYEEMMRAIVIDQDETEAAPGVSLNP